MFVTNWISTTKIQKISEITNFFRHYFLSRTEVGLQPADRNPHQRPLSGERKGSLQRGVCYLRRHQPQQHRPAYPGEQGVPSPLLCRRSARHRCHHRRLQSAGRLDHRVCGGTTYRRIAYSSFETKSFTMRVYSS